jgi:hypothetical protein
VFWKLKTGFNYFTWYNAARSMLLVKDFNDNVNNNNNNNKTTRQNVTVYNCCEIGNIRV